MFDFAWSEIALIAGVALLVIGPKDLPVALRAISGFVKKARRMAGEFQSHVDEMMRDADLKDVRDSISEIRNFDFRGKVAKVIDPDRTLRDTFSDDPFNEGTASGNDLAGGVTTESTEPEAEEPPPEPPPPRPRIAAPAFVPPALVPYAEPPEAPPPMVPPSFIPTGTMLQPPSS
jgi:sec-independent protein translocase protein TatB